MTFKLELTKNDDDFCLLTAQNEDVKIVIEDVSLIVRKNTLADYKLNEMSATLLKNEAKYFFHT